MLNAAGEDLSLLVALSEGVRMAVTLNLVCQIPVEDRACYPCSNEFSYGQGR